MKKFYLCKLCLIVFGALLAVQGALAKEHEVWYCLSTADIFILPDGRIDNVQKREGTIHKWKLKLSESSITIDIGIPDELGVFKILSKPKKGATDAYAAISDYGYALIHFYPKTGVLNVSRHEASMVNGIQLQCSKF